MATIGIGSGTITYLNKVALELHLVLSYNHLCLSGSPRNGRNNSLVITESIIVINQTRAEQPYITLAFIWLSLESRGLFAAQLSVPFR